MAERDLIETLPPYDEHTALQRVLNALDSVYRATDGETVILDIEPGPTTSPGSA